MKRRTFLMMAGGLAGGLVVTDCSSDAGTPATGGTGGGAAGGAKVLSLYTSSPKDQYEPAVSAFKKTGYEVEVVSAGTGELIKRIQAEGANPLADVQWGGLGQSVAPALASFAEFVPADDASFLPDYQSKAGGDKRLVPFSIMLNSLMVNTKQTGGATVEGWESLLDPALKGKIAFADPAKSSSSLSQIVNMLHAMGNGNPEDGWGYVEKFAKQLDNKMQGSSSNVFNMVSTGEYAVGVTNETNAVKYAALQSEIKTVYPKEGTMVLADYVMLIKNAKNTESGKAFINYLTGKDYQSTMEEYGLRTVRADVTQKAFPALDTIKVVAENKAWMDANGAKIKDRFMDAFTK